jgi:hypothetical protein
MHDDHDHDLMEAAIVYAILRGPIGTLLGGLVSLGIVGFLALWACASIWDAFHPAEVAARKVKEQAEQVAEQAKQAAYDVKRREEADEERIKSAYKWGSSQLVVVNVKSLADYRSVDDGEIYIFARQYYIKGAGHDYFYGWPEETIKFVFPEQK